jgi:hypothetical protein
MTLKFNEDLSSAAYKPGNNCSAIGPTIGGSVVWSTHKLAVQYPCADKQPFTSDDGYFALWTFNGTTPSGGKTSGGGIHTEDATGAGFNAANAYFEALIKLPTPEQGIHATWWFRNPQSAPTILQFNNPEIDLMEFGVAETATSSGSFQTNLHVWNGANATNIDQYSRTYSIPPGNGWHGMGSGWHVFGLRVEAGGTLHTYLDGNPLDTFSSLNSCFSQPLAIRFSMSQDGGFSGTPREFGCKYVRCWTPMSP